MMMIYDDDAAVMMINDAVMMIMMIITMVMIMMLMPWITCLISYAILSIRNPSIAPSHQVHHNNNSTTTYYIIITDIIIVLLSSLCFHQLIHLGTCLLHVPAHLRYYYSSYDLWQLCRSYEVWSNAHLYGFMALVSVLSHRPCCVASQWYVLVAS